MNNTTKLIPIDEIAGLISGNLPVVFETLFRLHAEPLAEGEFSARGQEVVVGSVGFIGDANGMVYLHLTAALAQKLASQMLGLPAAELDDEMVNDVIGELSNVVVGAVKSQICDSGAPCTLTIPSIMRATGLSVETLRTEEREALYFACGDDTLLITILMKQP
jgi:CheY-specific phosphatase CheX